MADTGAVFTLRKPPQVAIERIVRECRELRPDCPALLSLGSGVVARRLPWGFSHDLTLGRIGRGEAAFAAARAALCAWLEFDLGWVRVANPSARVAVGELVAVEAHTLGLWSVNLSRITETVDTATRFGFLYTTTRCHVEEGQERFVVELSAGEDVLFLIEAVSRPRHALARLGWPVVRALQARFRRDSLERMAGVGQRG